MYKHILFLISYISPLSIGSTKNSKFDEFTKKTFGRMMNTPMTRDESVRILGLENNIESIKDDIGMHSDIMLQKPFKSNYKSSNIDPTDIMNRFEELFGKNDVEKGGSFYLQSKIYFAKEFLMQDHPPELNISRYNPDEEQDDGDDAGDDSESKNNEEESKTDTKSESNK